MFKIASTCFGSQGILHIFKYFIIILIAPKNYRFVHLLDNKVF